MEEKKKSGGEFVQGTLDMLILKTLIRGPLHGYAIAEFIRSTSEEVLRVEEGALYPALHRLELRGLLASVWGTSDNNRRAKYYRITAAGSHLAHHSSRRSRFSRNGAVRRLLCSRQTTKNDGLPLDRPISPPFGGRAP